MFGNKKHMVEHKEWLLDEADDKQSIFLYKATNRHRSIIFILIQYS